MPYRVVLERKKVYIYKTSHSINPRYYAKCIHSEYFSGFYSNLFLLKKHLIKKFGAIKEETKLQDELS